MRLKLFLKKAVKAVLPYGIVILIVRIKQLKRTTKEIFTEIKKKNLWGSGESVSGPGSTIIQTETLVVQLSNLLKENNIKTLLDIPCGDFNWMQKVDLSNIDYIGADIVDDLIKENTEKYETNNCKFMVLDLIKDTLPLNCDLIFVRDCFVHLSYKHIFEALENIKKSGSKYLLTTTFTEHNKNSDIITGSWRPINLEISPFSFSKPKCIFVENYLWDDEYKDKSMGLWEIKKL